MHRQALSEDDVSKTDEPARVSQSHDKASHDPEATDESQADAQDEQREDE